MARSHLGAVRKTAGFRSTREIAAHIRCSAQAVSSFEQGRIPITGDLLEKYASAIGVNTDHVRRLFLQDAREYHKAMLESIDEQMRALVPRRRRQPA